MNELGPLLQFIHRRPCNRQEGREQRKIYEIGSQFRAKMKPFLCWKKDEEDKKRMQGSIEGLKKIIKTNNECMRDNVKQI